MLLGLSDEAAKRLAPRANLRELSFFTFLLICLVIRVGAFSLS